MSESNAKWRRWLGTGLAALLLAPVAGADRLVTNDGRILEVKKARVAAEGGYTLTFENGEIHCPAEFVLSVEIEGDMADYVPADDNEKKKLEDGFVRFRGKWMSKIAYEAALSKEAERRRKRVEELAEHADFFNGWEKETSHFQVRTNTSPELLEYYCDLLESYYTLMNKRVGIKPTPRLRRTKMKVNIYKSRENFHELNEAGVGGGVAGYFSFLEESLNFYHDYEEPAISNWVALHETTHLLTYLIEPQSWPQIWINEGVADFFGSADITFDKKGKLEITPGKLQLDRVLTVQQAIRDGDYVTLEKLFRIDKANFHAFEYAHSWSFVYFLNNSSKQYESGFKRFFKDHYTLAKGIEYEAQPFPNQQGTAKIVPPHEVRRLLLKCLRVKDSEVPELEKEWLEFVKSIEIDAPAARFKRAQNALMRYDKDQFELAREDLDFAISEGIEDPRAYWTRGALRIIEEQDTTGAEGDFRRAIELAPLNSSFRYSLGQLLAGSGFRTGGYTLTITDADGNMGLFGEPEEIQEAKLCYGMAMELDPESDYYREQFESFMASYDKYQEERE